MSTSRRQKTNKRKAINDETLNISNGPVLLDVEHARMWGWTEKEIERVFDEIAKISQKVTAKASKRRPDHWQEGIFGAVFKGPVPARSKCGYCNAHLMVELRTEQAIKLAECVQRYPASSSAGTDNTNEPTTGLVTS